MKLNLTDVIKLLQAAPEIITAVDALVHSPHVSVVDSAGQPVSPTVIADLVSVATASAVAGVQAAG